MWISLNFSNCNLMSDLIAVIGIMRHKGKGTRSEGSSRRCVCIHIYLSSSSYGLVPFDAFASNRESWISLVRITEIKVIGIVIPNPITKGIIIFPITEEIRFYFTYLNTFSQLHEIKWVQFHRAIASSSWIEVKWQSMYISISHSLYRYDFD